MRETAICRREGLVRREGGETFGLRGHLGSQEVNQAQGLTSGGPASQKLGAEGTRNLRLRFELETTRLFNSTSILGFLCYAPSLKQAGPPAGELEGALADGGAERLVGGDGVEPFGLRFVVGSQEVKQTQGLTLRS